MTPVATSPLFIEGGERFIPHIIRIKDIPPDLRASMTEVWDAMMDLNHFNDTLLSDSLTDRVLGQYTGRSGRFVQKGLKGLQDHGIIFRHTEHGRRNIEITGRIAKRKDKPAAPEAKPKPKRKTTESSSVPNLQTPTRDATEEELAAAAGQIAEATAGPAPDEELSPTEVAARLRIMMASAAAAPTEQPAPRPAPVPRPRKRVNPALDQVDPKTMAEVLAQLEAKKAHPARE